MVHGFSSYNNSNYMYLNCTGSMSHVRRSTCPKVHLSEGPLVRRFTCPKVHMPEGSRYPKLRIDKHLNFMTYNRDLSIPSWPTLTRPIGRSLLKFKYTFNIMPEAIFTTNGVFELQKEKTFI